MLGAPSGAMGCVNGSQSGTESLMSMLTTPWNERAMTMPPTESTGAHPREAAPGLASPIVSEAGLGHYEAGDRRDPAGPGSTVTLSPTRTQWRVCEKIVALTVP